MNPIWDLYRDEHGFIDIAAALEFEFNARGMSSRDKLMRAFDFVDDMAQFCPVTSPAAADVVFQHALKLAA